MDSCIAIALNQQLGPSKGATTVEMKLNYLRPVNKGILKGQGRVIQAGRRILVGQGEIRDEEDNLVAIGTATFVIIDKPFNLRTS
jgi:acyl-CoA thioesterase